MTNDDKRALELVLAALDRLMKIFAIERVLYLIGAFASLLLFIFAGYRLFSQAVVSTSDMALILGSTGVATACASRVAFFLDRAFKLIESTVEVLLKAGGSK